MPAASAPSARAFATSRPLRRPPDAMTVSQGEAAWETSRRDQAVGMPQSARNWRRLSPLRAVSMAGKLVPPAPATLKHVKPRACSSSTCSRAMPQPVSLRMTGTVTASRRRARLSRRAAKSRSPSGMQSSCAALRWISSASASSMATAARASSGVARALRLAKRIPSGYSSRTMA